MQAQVVRGRPVRIGLIDFFSPAIVNSQIAQVDRPKIFERMVFGSSPFLCGVIVTVKLQIFVWYLFLYFRTFEKSTKFNTVWKFLFVFRLRLRLRLIYLNRIAEKV